MPISAIASGVGPFQAGIADGRREIFVLGEEPIAGMNGVGPGARGGIDDPIDRQVTLARRARADGVRLVGVADVKRRTIAVGINRGRRDAHFAARSRNAHGDLAAIGYEHFSHERRHCSPAKSRTLHALAR